MDYYAQKTERNYSIDFLKGILILLVIIGHITLGELEDSLLRYIIYSFHMPLFIGISGYLFSNIRDKNISLSILMKRYWQRVGIPWIFAVIFYFLVLNFDTLKSGITTQNIFLYVKSFLYPYYHLWYVLGFVFYVFLTFFLMKLTLYQKYGWKILLIISLVLSISSKLIGGGGIITYSYRYCNMILEFLIIFFL